MFVYLLDGRVWRVRWCAGCIEAWRQTDKQTENEQEMDPCQLVMVPTTDPQGNVIWINSQRRNTKTTVDMTPLPKLRGICTHGTCLLAFPSIVMHARRQSGPGRRRRSRGVSIRRGRLSLTSGNIRLEHTYQRSHGSAEATSGFRTAKLRVEVGREGGGAVGEEVMRCVSGCC